MSKYAPGDEVVCIKSEFRRHESAGQKAPVNPVLNAHYVVIAVMADSSSEYLAFAELGFDNCYEHTAFRLVKREAVEEIKRVAMGVTNG